MRSLSRDEADLLSSLEALAPEASLPGFDPLGGGLGARLLILLEKPSGLAHENAVVSPDNGERNTVRLLLERAGVPRTEVLIWNAVPWWNGTAKVTAGERRLGADALRKLIVSMPNLRAAALAGRTAETVWQQSRAGAVPVFVSAHPSPNVRAGYPERWNAIPGIWREAYEASVLA
ncbi:uracil-DNA glycosylase family protein [Parvularcula maris]|uniref:Uracil-DNA glycosylase-like domain-containing protein n=1 Tax=Parvularcula maris TaxID=2965077 RepID=A0A9X2L7I2_9PROT|nr:uracil-DNA glycosylase family protein [Parvularcula maris]MCQ8184393.1 hypothetical protein [Parvularcula maris]